MVQSQRPITFSARLEVAREAHREVTFISTVTPEGTEGQIRPTTSPFMTLLCTAGWFPPRPPPHCCHN